MPGVVRVHRDTEGRRHRRIAGFVRAPPWSDDRGMRCHPRGQTSEQARGSDRHTSDVVPDRQRIRASRGGPLAPPRMRPGRLPHPCPSGCPHVPTRSPSTDTSIGSLCISRIEIGCERDLSDARREPPLRSEARKLTSVWGDDRVGRSGKERNEGPAAQRSVIELVEGHHDRNLPRQQPGAPDQESRGKPMAVPDRWILQVQDVRSGGSHLTEKCWNLRIDQDLATRRTSYERRGTSIAGSRLVTTITFAPASCSLGSSGPCNHQHRTTCPEGNPRS